MLRPSQVLLCFLMPSSSIPSQDYETRWITPSGAVITRSTDISGRYVTTEGAVPVNGISHPGAILGIQSLSYTDAGIYMCEARPSNSTDETDWASASFHLQLNSKLGLVHVCMILVL